MSKAHKIRCQDGATACQLANLINHECPSSLATFYVDSEHDWPHVITDAPSCVIDSLARLIGVQNYKGCA